MEIVDAAAVKRIQRAADIIEGLAAQHIGGRGIDASDRIIRRACAKRGERVGVDGGKLRDIDRICSGKASGDAGDLAVADSNLTDRRALGGVAITNIADQCASSRRCARAQRHAVGGGGCGVRPERHAVGGGDLRAIAEGDSIRPGQRDSCQWPDGNGIRAEGG